MGIPISSVGVTDHDALTNNGGAGSHASLTAHVADGSIHFTESSISHLNIGDIGSNNHATIDAHLASTSNPHSVSLEQARTVSNVVAGIIDMGSNRITNVTDPTADQDAATRDYHDRAYLGRNRTSYVESEFTEFGNVATGVTAVAAGAGAINGTASGVDKVDHPGIWCLETGTTSAGRVFIISSATRGYNLGGAGITRLGSIVKTGVFLSTALEEYTDRVGFFNISLPNTIIEGVGFEYAFDQNGGRWQGLCEDGVQGDGPAAG